MEQLSSMSKTDFRIFGKPTSRPYRRMGVVVTHDSLNRNITEVTNRAKEAAKLITVNK